jgi:N-terminal acetyltransferase B complex catalytic subunit
MATIRPFNLFDTLVYNNINLDILTETVILINWDFKYYKQFNNQFNTSFYAKYILKWPEYCVTMENCTGKF